MPHAWPQDLHFSDLRLKILDRDCRTCDGKTYVADYKRRKLFTLEGPLRVASQMANCADSSCLGHHQLLTPEAESLLAPPWWLIGWDVFAHIGQRRFSRHFSVPEIREELIERFEIAISEDAIEDYIGRYQAIVAARQRDRSRLVAEYASVKSLVLSIDGLQPEKGHEALYTVREINANRVWFARPLLSSSEAEVEKLFIETREWAEAIGKPVRAWISDKQEAFVKGVAKVFAGVPHRYCQNHFLRDVAEPVLEEDSHAKVKMRNKVRGLRSIEAGILEDHPSPEQTREPQRVVMDYCSAVRGILNRNQGGPLDPPGLRMAVALAEVRASIQRNLDIGRGDRAHRDLERLVGCIDRGLAEVSDALKVLPARVADLRAIEATLDPANGTVAKRQSRFEAILRRLQNNADPIQLKMSGVMERFQPGLFVGGERIAKLRDNLELERWFRLPKSHERRIHGRQHAGVRIVQEGPSLVLALDAHRSHRGAFTIDELRPYVDAQPTSDELGAVKRRKIMRKAASRKRLPPLLSTLESRYAGRDRPRSRSRRPFHASSG